MRQGENKCCGRQRDGDKETDLAHLFVHFYVKAVGHLVILKNRRTSVYTPDYKEFKLTNISCMEQIKKQKSYNEYRNEDNHFQKTE